jgi:bifunctional DNA-binding transcriptional regulator/antitoxin component of YhaV-PrlF toxin-antitoxin module
MPSSTVGPQFQTTLPKEARRSLSTETGDVLQVVGDQVCVTAAAPVFLELRGNYKVGPGDSVEDVRAARESFVRP